MKKQCLIFNLSILLWLIGFSHSTLNTLNKNNTSTNLPKRKKEKFSLSKSCNLNKFFSNDECDIISTGPICSYSGKKIILPKKNPTGLVGYWNFDDIRVIDSTGNRNHARNIIKAGPSMSGQGSSGLFTNGDYLIIPYNDSFNNNEFTITFWMFLIKDYMTQNKGIRYCPIIQRGKDDLFNKVFKRSPGLYYDRVQKNLKIFLSTKSTMDPQGEELTSNSKINTQRWMHIAIIKGTNKLKLFINGILDNTLNFKSENISIKDDFYIGGVPWLKDSCQFPYLIDEMRYYGLSIEEELIQAEASPALGGLDPTFITLGGISLDVNEASNSCQEGYHICTSIELHTGGYQVARSLGWLDWNTHIWSHGALKTPNEFIGMKGLALCCSDLK